MSRYLYGLLRADAASAPEAVAGLCGLQGAAVEINRFGEVSVIHSAHDGSEILRTRRQMQAHTRVLEALVGHGPLLPARFGLVSASAAELASLIEGAQERIRAEFERIAGQVELGLRIAWPREAAIARLLEADPGLARARDALRGRGLEAHYERIALGRRVAEALERRRTDAQRQLVRRLAGHCTDHVLRAPESDVEVLRMECLLPSDATAALADAVEQATAGVDFAGAAEPQIRLIGPLPPYNFVDLSLWPRREMA